MIRQLTNISAGTVVLTDMHGLSIASSETVDGLQFGEAELRLSNDVILNILQGKLTVHDGINTYTDGSAIDIIRGTSSQVTKDGKQIITASDRPLNTYRYFSTRGDDMTNHVIGEGEELTFLVPAGQTVQKDLQFLEDLYIKDGQVHYWGVEDYSHLDMTVVCPAGIPFQAPALNGNYDLVGTTWTPNANNTGAYFILQTETTIFRFVNHYPLTKFDGFGYIESPEPQLFPTPYKFRISVTNNNTTDNLRAAVLITMYRKHTVGTL